MLNGDFSLGYGSTRSRGGYVDVQSYWWKGSRFWPQKRSFFGVNPTGPHILVVILKSLTGLIGVHCKFNVKVIV
ncbi:uncharacterized protein N7529_009340 [Penicillium soppii]|uniref:uncharacterized protein n=1 Tax=Penicillium soppii TaxID=69789 RepID=UPI002547DD20|nr:uncharacterized protein N7529_009340 [Penicillium soppii]KAJ5855396.1 hypothetical protein N7529_009340 [Penicillium soppii]